MGNRPAGNPWLSIWTSPRLTLAEIVSSNPSFRFFFFCFIYGFVALLQGAQQTSLGLQYSAGLILLIAAIVGFFVGYISLSISSLLLLWTGKWIKGKGNYKQVRAAVAWSNVPVAVDLVIWLALTAVFGSLLFTEDFARIRYLQSPEGSVLVIPQLGLLIGLGIVRFILSIWSIVILIGGLSQVQSFSILRGVANVLLAIGVVIAAVIIAYFLIGWAVGFKG